MQGLLRGVNPKTILNNCHKSTTSHSCSSRRYTSGAKSAWNADFHPDVTRQENRKQRRQGTLWRINAIKSKRGRLQAMPSRTHGRPWPCEWVARSAGMERSGRFRRAQPEPDGYCNSNGCACEAHYRTHLRRNSFIPAAKVKSQCRVDGM